jgi:hypothetical protein
VELRVPAERLRSRDVPLVCVKTGDRADHGAPVAAGGEEFLLPVSRAAVRAERAARRVELATYAGGLTVVALVTGLLLVTTGRPPEALVLVLLAAALAAGLLATARRRRGGVRARRDGDDVVLTGVSPVFAEALRPGAPPR